MAEHTNKFQILNETLQGEIAKATAPHRASPKQLLDIDPGVLVKEGPDPSNDKGLLIKEGPDPSNDKGLYVGGPSRNIDPGMDPRHDPRFKPEPSLGTEFDPKIIERILHEQYPKTAKAPALEPNVGRVNNDASKANDHPPTSLSPKDLDAIRKAVGDFDPNQSLGNNKASQAPKGKGAGIE